MMRLELYRILNCRKTLSDDNLQQRTFWTMDQKTVLQYQDTFFADVLEATGMGVELTQQVDTYSLELPDGVVMSKHDVCSAVKRGELNPTHVCRMFSHKRTLVDQTLSSRKYLDALPPIILHTSKEDIDNKLVKVRVSKARKTQQSYPFHITGSPGNIRFLD